MNWAPEKTQVSAGEINNRKAGVLAWKSLGLSILSFVTLTIDLAFLANEKGLGILLYLYPIAMFAAFVFAIRAFRLFLAGEYPRPMTSAIALVLSSIGMLAVLWGVLVLFSLGSMH